MELTVAMIAQKFSPEQIELLARATRTHEERNEDLHLMTMAELFAAAHQATQN